MPLVPSRYHPPLIFRNGHVATIYSAKFRPAPFLNQTRERIILSDGDFLDIDWSYPKSTSRKLTILLHGLEGNAQRPYIIGQARVLNASGWDVAAINFRGCSGESNLSYQSYNAGKTGDLKEVIDQILERDLYDEINLLGFSLGGNLLLKYLGERLDVPFQIKKAVAISTPLSLKGSLESLEKPENWVYRRTFLNTLREKYKLKMRDFPDRMSVSEYEKITSLMEFDNIYTAPAHGFKDALDYYEKNSSLQFLPNITIPLYILNALNDSFLSSECYPADLAKKMPNLYFEMSRYGGHVGFHKSNTLYYSEQRALEFLSEDNF